MSWQNGEDVMKWWVGDDTNQLSLFDVLEDVEE